MGIAPSIACLFERSLARRRSIVRYHGNSLKAAIVDRLPSKVDRAVACETNSLTVLRRLRRSSTVARSPAAALVFFGK